MPKLNPELEKLSNFLEKYVEALRVEINRCDEKLKSEEIVGKQSSELQSQKQELETKIEKVQSYLDKIKISEDRNFVELGKPKKHWGSTEGLEKPLCDRYVFEYDNRSVTLDISQELNKKLKLTLEDVFYVPEEVLTREVEEGGITIKEETEIFLQRDLVEEETNKGKIAGAFGGIGVGAAGGAATGAGAMLLLSPYTFGFSLAFAPVAATVGAVVGGLSGGATGLAVGSITDKISNSKIAEIKNEIKKFLEEYKTMLEKESSEFKEVETYIESSNHWK